MGMMAQSTNCILQVGKIEKGKPWDIAVVPWLHLKVPNGIKNESEAKFCQRKTSCCTLKHWSPVPDPKSWQSFMEPSSGRLPGLEATRPHMEPRATCSAAAPLVERQFRVLVGVTGSVAALKLPLLVSRLLDIPGLEVAVVTTERAKHFYSPQDVPVTLYSDADEWEMWKCRSDPVLHIDLRRWADLMLVAPLDANTLGKVASGICDNLLTCVIRAWDRSKPLLFCPAMNTAMWEHPVTEQQVGQLKAFGYVEIPCVVKKLVCGDQGLGAMAEVGTIVDKVKEVLSQHGGFQQN
ncbi:phosphopantothenoylcysteine decarboxylase isoform X2 [Eschrichtius robustus]|uniref:phosphopantothenoylcysteine decarboxylase isoform X2 n=2 Tax=Mysticeti TaxID=9761 RepID=UPI0035BF1DF3